jgi:hypothetical protein
VLLAITMSDEPGIASDKTDLELVTEWLIIEEDPRILILAVPMVFQLAHTLHEPWELRISNKAYECSTRP